MIVFILVLIFVPSSLSQTSAPTLSPTTTNAFNLDKGCHPYFSEDVCNADHPQCGYGTLPGTTSIRCRPCDFYDLLVDLSTLLPVGPENYTETNCNAFSCCEWNGTNCTEPTIPCTRSPTFAPTFAPTSSPTIGPTTQESDTSESSLPNWAWALVGVGIISILTLGVVVYIKYVRNPNGVEGTYLFIK